jgi:hypothetical protein
MKISERLRGSHEGTETNEKTDPNDKTGVGEGEVRKSEPN